MTTAELLTSLRDALANDDTLVDWCTSNLGSAPTIQIDFDDQGEIEDYPLIALIQISQEDGINSPRRNWVLNGSVFVKNSDKTETTVNGCKTITYDGRLESEGLLEQTIASIFRSKLGCKFEIQGEAMSHTFHPRYVSPFVITINRVSTFST